MLHKNPTKEKLSVTETESQSKNSNVTFFHGSTSFTEMKVIDWLYRNVDFIFLSFMIDFQF